MWKVLIVEDENIIRKGLVFTIDWYSLGCVVVGEGRNGLDGLEKIRSLQPDIVIADIRMPQMDGLEMIRQASVTNRFCSILLTSYSEFEYAQAAVSLHAFEYLLKPVDDDRLKETILRACRRLEEGLHANPSHTSAAPGDPLSLQALENLDALFYSGVRFSYYVRRVLETIREEYPQRLSIHGLASRFGVSDSYLSRKFKEETSSTFVEFLNKYRIQRAIALLEEGNLRIGEVAEQVGFGEYKQFSAVFRRYVGMSCSEFCRTRFPGIRG